MLRMISIIRCAGVRGLGSILWKERSVRSVANLTRRDAEEFLALAPEAGIRTETVTYPLANANDALADLRNGALQGAAVLIP
jgi:alcohol dehydrogenase, propanol-preferring